MLPTLAFAPRAEDLEEGFFDAPVIAFATPAPRSEAPPLKLAPKDEREKRAVPKR